MIIPVNLFFFQQLPQQKSKADSVSALLQQTINSNNLTAARPNKNKPTDQVNISCKIAACAAH
jgi:hypothetical protein